MATISVHPVSYDNGYSAYSVTNLNYAYADSTNGTYAQINLTRGSGAITEIYYNFGSLSSIPVGAIIDSVSCSAKGFVNTTTAARISTREVQLFSGSTAKGSASLLNNAVSTYSLTTGTWTREELQNAKIRWYVVRNTSNTSTNYYIRFYGATLAVTYTEPSTGNKVFIKSNGTWKQEQKKFVKVSGTWKEVSKIFKKVNGSWVQQDDISAMFDVAAPLVKSD